MTLTDKPNVTPEINLTLLSNALINAGLADYVKPIRRALLSQASPAIGDVDSKLQKMQIALDEAFDFLGGCDDASGIRGRILEALHQDGGK